MSKIFSLAERDFVKQLVVGKPSGFVVTLGGIDIDLVPLTTQQGKDVIALVDRVIPAFDGAKSKSLEITVEQLIGTLKNESDAAMKIARDWLWRSVVANELVDQANGGQDVFDEWFAELAFIETMRTLFQAVGPANGMGSLLGNPSTPPSESAAEKNAEAPAVEQPESVSA